jgi:hypothetical protein
MYGDRPEMLSVANLQSALFGYSPQLQNLAACGISVPFLKAMPYGDL